jgi:predicted dehydrogenase
MSAEKHKHGISRRRLLGAASTAVATFTIAPRHVLGGPGQAAPSDTITYGVIGNGKRKDAGLRGMKGFTKIAVCDVDTAHMANEAKGIRRYTDFRKMLEQKDIDVVCIGTPPHWHAIPCIMAAQAGKDIFCEKPMTKFIAEGRAVADAVKRYGVVFQIGTFKRFNSQNKKNIQNRKIIRHGLLESLDGVVTFCGARNRTGKPALSAIEPIPEVLDYDLWLGPAPFKPYNPARVHYSNRFYWDYEGGDLTNFGAHSVDPAQWIFGKDDTSPVRVEAGPAPWPQHPDAVGQFSWVECTYADGLKIVLTGGNFAAKYNRPKKKGSVSIDDLDEDARKRYEQLPDPPKLVDFGTAVRTRQWAGGHAESSHRVCTLMHLANISIRLGRVIKYDPEKEQIIGDDEAARLVDIPMRAPWHL